MQCFPFIFVLFCIKIILVGKYKMLIKKEELLPLKLNWLLDQNKK